MGFGYDPDGNQTSMADGSGTTTLTYDRADRLTRAVKGADTDEVIRARKVAMATSRERWNLTKKMIEATSAVLPEFDTQVRNWAQQWQFNAALDDVDLPGPHSFASEMLNPVIVLPALSADIEDGEFLSRVFSLLEHLATLDENLQNVVEVSVCEVIGDDLANLARARKYMHPRTLDASIRMEQFHGRG